MQSKSILMIFNLITIVLSAFMFNWLYELCSIINGTCLNASEIINGLYIWAIFLAAIIVISLGSLIINYITRIPPKIKKTEIEETIHLCSSCGQKLGEGETICPECGTKTN